MQQQPESSHDVIVVGAGMAGLSAAFYLVRRGLRVVVLEQASKAGGAIQTGAGDGWLFERGPNTVMARGDLARLIVDLGLEDDVIESNPEARRRFIFQRGRLIELPSRPLGMVRTPLFPLSAKLRLLWEPWVRPLEAGAAASEGDDFDESIADFVRRRAGQPWLDYAVGPFTSGVYAGDPEQLSTRWAMPKVWALERRFGSLLRGVWAGRGHGASRGRMISFRDGLHHLPRALASHLPDLRLESRAESVERSGDRFMVRGDNFSVIAPQLVVTTPAAATGRLLEKISSLRSGALGDVPQASLAVVSLGYRRDQVDHPLDGFGFLAPRCEPLRILGCLFPSSVFPERAPQGRVALSAFLGGRLDPDLLDLSDDDIVAITERDLGIALGARGEPEVSEVTRWQPAIPQYELGHQRFVQTVRSLEGQCPGLLVAGNYVDGASVPDCVTRGVRAAERVMAAHQTHGSGG